MDINSHMPALRWHKYTSWYGLVCSASNFGSRFKKKIIKAAYLNGDELIADIGCGEGTFLAELCAYHPNIRAYGIDPDETLLSQTRKRLFAVQHQVTLEKGLAQSLPHPDETFDVVFCTLTLHHLSDENKVIALHEMYRVLKPEGRIIITDFGPKRFRWLPSFFPLENMIFLKSCLDGTLPHLLQDVGFNVNVYTPFQGNRTLLLVGNKSSL